MIPVSETILKFSLGEYAWDSRSLFSIIVSTTEEVELISGAFYTQKTTMDISVPACIGLLTALTQLDSISDAFGGHHRVRVLRASSFATIVCNKAQLKLRRGKMRRRSSSSRSTRPL